MHKVVKRIASALMSLTFVVSSLGFMFPITGHATTSSNSEQYYWNDSGMTYLTYDKKGSWGDAKLADGVYTGGTSISNLLSSKDLNNTVISKDIRFSSVEMDGDHRGGEFYFGGTGERMIIGTPDEDKIMETALITIYLQKDTSHFPNKLMLLLRDESGESIEELRSEIAGINLIDNTFNLKISTKIVDLDGDGANNDIEAGIWINNKLYGNAFKYLKNCTNDSNKYMLVKVTKGSLIWGTQQTQNLGTIDWCMDNYAGAAYFPESKDGLKINGIVKTESEMLNPGTYDIEVTEQATEGSNLFKQKVTVYKTNDITLSGSVDVRDLVRMKKLADTSITDVTENTLDDAAKKAIGLQNSGYSTEQALNAIREELLNTVSPRKEFQNIAYQGESGSISAVQYTNNGTVVLTMADALKENPYTTSKSQLTQIDAWGLDYVLNFEEEPKDGIKILQFTDPQIVDSALGRGPEEDEAFIKTYSADQMDTLLFYEMDELVKTHKPDLILVTGDLTYGEYDDGTSLRKLINKMDSYKIPWAPVFGNHDQASSMTLTEQCQLLRESTYCLFYKRAEIGGMGNYSIGLSVDGKLQRMIYMMDSCYNQEDGIRRYTYTITDEQFAWYKTCAVKANQIVQEQTQNEDTIPSFLCTHISTAEFHAGALQSGCVSNSASYDQVVYDSDVAGSVYQTNGLNDTNSTFGFIYKSQIGWYPRFIYEHLQTAYTDGMFVGHLHGAALSTMYEGIRFTLGLKTGQYAGYYQTTTGERKTGGTLITIQGKHFGVKYVQEEKWSSIF